MNDHHCEMSCLFVMQLDPHRKSRNIRYHGVLDNKDLYNLNNPTAYKKAPKQLTQEQLSCFSDKMYQFLTLVSAKTSQFLGTRGQLSTKHTILMFSDS